MTYRFCSDDWVIEAGRLFPICAFLTRVSVVNAPSEEKRSSGKGVTPVDSRSRVVNDPQDDTPLGSAPPVNGPSAPLDDKRI